MQNRETIRTEQRGEGTKVLSLHDAVQRHLQPGMALHLAGGIGGPSAAICEIVRQFRGTNPGFTLIQSTVTGHGPTLIHLGLVKKLVFAGCMEISESTRPSSVFQRAYREKTVEAENWSLCSLQQRLMAGAMGLPFLPTKSLRGSSLAEELRASFAEVEDPFGGGRKVGVVEALTPDLSIVHGCVADAEGNTILGAPMGDDLWGALASRGGVIVTVEEIVPSDTIRQHASLVKIPGYVVRAVCKTPLGAHPFSFLNPGVPGAASYEMDRAFLVSLAGATREKRLTEWVEEWVLGCGSHNEFLDRLGDERVRGLRDAAAVQSAPLKSLEPSEVSDAPASVEETILVAVAREVAASVRRSGHKVVLVGAGNRAVAPWLAYGQLRAEGFEVELMTGNGQVAYTPLPGESFLQTTRGLRSARMLTDTVTTHAVVVGGGSSSCLSVLGAAQVDRHGNLNSTRLSEEVFLVGSGGGNDSMNAHEVIVVMDQSCDRFAEKLPYVTSVGDRVTSVISQYGVFRKSGGELRLAAYFSEPELDRARTVERIRAACGWPLQVEEALKEVPAPTSAELEGLRRLLGSDPAARR